MKNQHDIKNLTFTKLQKRQFYLGKSFHNYKVLRLPKVGSKLQVPCYIKNIIFLLNAAKSASVLVII